MRISVADMPNRRAIATFSNSASPTRCGPTASTPEFGVEIPAAGQINLVQMVNRSIDTRVS
jgi:hypothetical protein